MSKKLEEELLDLGKWYFYHKTDSMPLEKRVEFLARAMDLTMWVIGRIAEDIQNLEGRGKSGGVIITDPYLRTRVPNRVQEK